MRADLWQRGCERLASELPDQQFNTWIRPLPDADVADNGEGAVVTVRVPNRFKLDWIRNQYAGRIETRAERARRQAGAPRRHAGAARGSARAERARGGNGGAPGHVDAAAARRGRSATGANGHAGASAGSGGAVANGVAHAGRAPRCRRAAGSIRR